MRSGRPWGVSKTRSRLLRRRRLASQVLEDLCPRPGVAIAEAVAIDDNAVPAEGDLDRVLDDVEVPDHSIVRLGYWERPVLVLAISDGLFEAGE